MSKQSTMRIGIAAAVAASGLTVGGVAMAQAADSKTESTQGAPDGVRGPGGHGRHVFGVGDKAAFAKELGVSEAKLTAALKAVRDDLRPDKADRPDPADRPDRSELRSKLAAALAKELGVSESKVTAAFDALQEERTAERRSKLSDRLDAAVKADKLTADDKASVLKAYDAGVLGGPANR